MSFSRDLRRYKDTYRRRLDYVAKTATLEVTNEANTPISQGGRLPLDTGALRASLVGQPGSMPEEGGEAVAAALIRWTPSKDLFYASWTVNYAVIQEYKNGFLAGATERWPEFVRRAARDAIDKIK